MYSFLHFNPHQKYVCMCVCTHIHNVYRTYTVRGLPSPFLLLPGVRGKIPGTQAFVTVLYFNERQEGVRWGWGGAREQDAWVPSSYQ